MTKSSDESGKKRGKRTVGTVETVELPAVTPDDAAGAVGAVDETPDEATGPSAAAEMDSSRVTHELEAIGLDEPDTLDGESPDADVAIASDHMDSADVAEMAEMYDTAGLAEERESGPSAEISAPNLAAPGTPRREVQPTDATDAGDSDGDLDALLQRAAVEPPPLERPRHNTLAAITRPRGGTDPYGAPPPPEISAVEESAPPEMIENDIPGDDISGNAIFEDEIPEDEANEGIPDETEGEGRGEDEWAIADQPTVSLAPGEVLSARPQFLDTDEHSSWPPRHPAELPIPGTLPEAAASLRRRAIPRMDRTGRTRYASPTGRPMPATPPGGIPRTELPNPRMQRYQELHRRRDAVEQGEPDPRANRPVTDRVRQWWGDLRPGLKEALDYQHEARASGVHPIAAAEPTQTSRLGDVFGRLTASARELTERAQSAAAPTFRRIHDQAEHAAQAIVGRFESNSARQQAPFLGPGRIAVFFRSGVSVGQAQRLLASKDARPLRIIPRKHGFLAYVLPGTEEEVSGRLKLHPYVRDVQFMPVNAYGDPLDEDEE